MDSLTIYYGANKPIKAIGKHQVNLLGFAEKYRGWHSYTLDPNTLNAVNALVRKGCLETNSFNQFRFTYPKV
jgi:hypothetical protein